MNAAIEPPNLSILTDEKLIAALKRRGPQTIEELSSESGMSWARMFSAVDRLSRIGAVSLRRVGPAYQVAYRRPMLSQPASFTRASTATAETPRPQA